jgi:cation diffusion facilitator CzcD-associated flavoprotein CzcO
MWVHEIVRRKITYEGAVFTQRCLDEPEKVREDLLGMVKAVLGEEFDIEKHFNPKYRPWQQRIAFIPDADLFKGIASGKASVVTDEIERFTQGGIELKSGEVLEADIIVTATGFHMSVMGGITFEVDGKPVDWSETVTYRGMMFTGVPNLVWVFGYFRASWTLRADMVGDFVCRLLNHMKATGTQQVEVGLRDEDRDMKVLPWIDEDNFNPNYLKRSIHLLPKRGDKKDWAHTQDYWNEKEEFPKLDLGDKAFHYA